MHFVHASSTVPPVHSSASNSGWVEVTRETPCPPVTVQEWTQLLMKTVRQLERFSGCQILPKSRTKVRTLFPLLGETAPWKGLQVGPIWTDTDIDELYKLLTRTLASGDAQTLIRHATAGTPRPKDSASALEERYLQMSTTAREKLARWLRGLRG